MDPYMSNASKTIGKADDFEQNKAERDRQFYGINRNLGSFNEQDLGLEMDASMRNFFYLSKQRNFVAK